MLLFPRTICKLLLQFSAACSLVLFFVFRFFSFLCCGLLLVHVQSLLQSPVYRQLNDGIYIVYTLYVCVLHFHSWKCRPNVNLQTIHPTQSVRTTANKLNRILNRTNNRTHKHNMLAVVVFVFLFLVSCCCFFVCVAILAHFYFFYFFTLLIRCCCFFSVFSSSLLFILYVACSLPLCSRHPCTVRVS